MSGVAVEQHFGEVGIGFRQRQTSKQSPSIATSKLAPQSLLRRQPSKLLTAARLWRPSSRRERRGKNTFTLTFCGDTSLGNNYISQLDPDGEANRRLHEAPLSFFEGVRPLLVNSDRVIVNLEAPLVKGLTSPFEGKKAYIGWSDPDRTVAVLKQLNVRGVKSLPTIMPWILVRTRFWRRSRD